MTAPCGLGAISGLVRWELVAPKRAPMQCKWALQPIGQKFGLGIFKLSDCNRMAAFGFGDHSPAMARTQIKFLFPRGYRRTRIGRMSVLVILRCLPSSQTERYGVGEERRIFIPRHRTRV